MRRREVIAILGSAIAWPLAARAQRERRVGILMAFDESNSRAKECLSQFTQGLSELGWNNGRNLRTEVRWAGDDVERMRMFAKELVDLQPAVILAFGTPVTAALHRETRTIAIVFVAVSDPVGEGYVANPRTNTRPIDAAVARAICPSLIMPDSIPAPALESPRSRALPPL